ncbi:MAG: DUF6179 domain-containing protein, partial [Clostridia bacterium]
MTNKLEPTRIIPRETLDERRYLESLLEAALSRAQVDDAWIEQTQGALLDLLAYQCRRYTERKSSSVRIEVSEEIMRSIVFTLDIWLREIPEPDDALRAITEVGFRAGYARGYRKIQTMVKATQIFYETTRRQYLFTDNAMYNATLNGGIAGFFQRYYPEFGAHTIHITADYPVALFPEGYQGIEFIRRYLVCVWYENQFCRMFGEDAMTRTWTRYAIEYGDTVRDMVCNLYEVILSAALACAIAGDPMANLWVSERGRAAVRQA